MYAYVPVDDANLQELFSMKKFGKGFKKGFKGAASVAGKAAPVIGAVAGPEAGVAAKAVSAGAAQWKLQNLQNDEVFLQTLHSLPPNMQVELLNANGIPATLENLDFWSDFAKGFKIGFQETAKVAQALSPLAEQYAKQHYGQEYADAIHSSTDTTSKIASGLDMIKLQQMEA